MFELFTIVNAIRWCVQVLVIFKDRGQCRRQFVPEMASHMAISIKCAVYVNYNQVNHTVNLIILHVFYSVDVKKTYVLSTYFSKVDCAKLVSGTDFSNFYRFLDLLSAMHITQSTFKKCVERYAFIYVSVSGVYKSFQSQEKR